MKIHVLFLTFGPPRLAEQSIARALQNAELRVTVHNLLPSKHKRTTKLLMRAAALRYYGRRWRPFVFYTPLAFTLLSRLSLRAARHYTPDIVLWAQCYAGLTLGERQPVTAYYTDHTNQLSKKSRFEGWPLRDVVPSWNQLEAAAFRSANLLFVKTDIVKQSLVADYSADPARIHVVYLGPNVDVDARRDRIAKDYTARRILFVGLDGRRKGIDVLLKAFRSIHHQFPEAELNVVGLEKQPMGEQTSGVLFLGRRYGEELKRLFYDSQIFVLPSRHEPGSNVLVEAMYAKAVPITTNVGGQPSLVKDGVTGFIVPVEDAGAIADRVLRLFSNPDSLRDMAEQGYSHAKQRFNWDVIGPRVAELLKSAVLPHTGPIIS